VNRSLARFFTLEPVTFPEMESGPRLMECGELANPEVADARELYADSKTGRGTAPQGGAVHGYEDNRDQHLDEVRRRFAAKVTDHLQKLARTTGARTIILAASARMRRFLYPGLETLVRQDYRVVKLSKNMINFSGQKIHAYLADEELVPRQKMG
jgi:hypothetical protein